MQMAGKQNWLAGKSVARVVHTTPAIEIIWELT